MRKCFVLFAGFTFFVFLLFSGVSLFAAETGGLYRSAMEHFTRAEFPKGVEKYYKFLISTSSLLQGESMKKDLRPARAYFVDLGKKEPRNPKPFFYLGLIYRMVNMMPPANRLIDRVLQQVPDSPLLTFVKGEFLFWQENPKEGWEFFSKLKNLPKGKNFLPLATLIQEHYGFDGDAKVRRDSKLREVYRYLDLFERKPAERLLVGLRKEFPEDLDVAKTLVNLYLELNRPKEAGKILGEMKGQYPENSDLDILTARACFQKCDYLGASIAGKSVLKKDPGNDYIRSLVAEAQFLTGNFSEAGLLFQEFMEKDPNNPGFIMRRKECFEGENKLPEAIKFLEEIVEQRPKNCLLKMSLAELYEKKNEFHSAVLLYYEVMQGSDLLYREEAKARYDLLKDGKTRENLPEAQSVNSLPGNVPPPPPVVKSTSSSPLPISVSSPGKEKGPVKDSSSRKLIKKLSVLYD